ncbi:MAG: TOBE domain-containing protein [Cellulomonas sp.]|nr:TOBE domain-containing protein [Cellulomonas sp.]
MLDGSAPPIATGTLQQLVYMGTDLRIQVALTDGTTLAVRVPPPFEGLALTPGATLTVGADPAHLRPLALEEA